MLRKLMIFLLIILSSSIVFAGHQEWYAKTDCYEKSRPNIEHCQEQYDDLRKDHYDACVNPSPSECNQYCQQFKSNQKYDCEQRCVDELPLAKARYFDCLEAYDNNPYKGIYDYNLKPMPESEVIDEPTPSLVKEDKEEPKTEPEVIGNGIGGSKPKGIDDSLDKPVEKVPEPLLTKVKSLIKPVAISSYVKGEVWVTRKDSTRLQVKSFTEFNNGDIIESKGGVATIKFSDGHKIIVGKNSKVTLGEKNEMSLSFGSIKAFFKKLLIPFNIETSGGTLTIKGTEFILAHNPKTDVSKLDLHEGEVDIKTNEGVDKISAGKSVTFDETGIISEEKLSESDWQALIKELELEEKINYIFFSLPILLVIAIIGLIVYFIVRKKKDKKGKISKLAVSSFILGIFSLLLGWFPFLGWVFIILTLVFGFMALKIIKTQNLSGRKLAILGLVMGFISLALALAFIGFISFS